MKTNDNIYYVLALALIVLATGCRSRCGNACGFGANGASTIAPPPTYSLNIPSTGGRSPYYVPGGATSTANLPSYLVDPNQRAPTPASHQTGNQNGWRPVNGNSLSGSSPVNNVQPATNANSATVFANHSPNQTNVRTASATALPGSGSVNYQTTRIDERRDPTRLPANDASNVRAPAQITNTNGLRLAQIQQPAQPVVFTGAPSVTGRGLQSGQPVYYGQAYAAPPAAQSYQAPQSVLAQSTTGLPGNHSGGWRDREITASRDSLNR